MVQTLLHRFELEGKRFAIDPESCFCFECDAISWDVLEHYPTAPVNRIYHLLRDKYDIKELMEVVGELEWLRASRSILTPPKRDDVTKIFDVERGLKELSITLSRQPAAQQEAARRWFRQSGPAAPAPTRELARDAIQLLLARSGTQKDLVLEFIEPREVHNPELIAELATKAFRAAALAGKNLVVAVRITNVEIARMPVSMKDHSYALRMELASETSSDVARHVAAFSELAGESLARIVKGLYPDAKGVMGRVIVQPAHPDFGGVAPALDDAGCGVIEIDLDAAFVAQPDLEPATMFDGMRQTAVYYAQRLLEHRYFKLDPFASLFWRIYTGTPIRRTDPAGTNELMIDEAGCVYPSRHFRMLKNPAAFILGSLIESRMDEEAVLRFDDVGALTTPVCMSCWARNLCGGGRAAVHEALSGSFRKPHPAWCDAQRALMAATITAFHQLSSAGVHFERVYKTLGRREKPSLFMLARAALTMSIGVRPIEEADAEMLTRWENWSESAYFLYNESGILLATKYDREMDSLHPRGIDQELVLLRKNGDPFGLLKVRPDRLPGVAHAWLFMREETDYASDSVRKSFRAILREAGGQQAIKRLLIPAAQYETALQDFVAAIGGTREGILREALYSHGQYRDVSLFAITTDNL